MARLFDEKYNYISNLYAKEDDILKEIRQRLEKDNKAINIGADEGKLLQLLVKISNTKSILEIGTLYGYSTIWLARAVGKKGKVITFEKEAENALKAEANFKKAGLEKIISLKVGDAKENLAKIKGKWDMIFIDAEKSGYLTYLEFAKKLVKKGGLIVADNVFQKGGVFNENSKEKSVQVMREFNKQLSLKKYFTTILNTHDGLLVAYIL